MKTLIFLFAFLLVNSSLAKRLGYISGKQLLVYVSKVSETVDLINISNVG